MAKAGCTPCQLQQWQCLCQCNGRASTKVIEDREGGVTCCLLVLSLYTGRLLALFQVFQISKTQSLLRSLSCISLLSLDHDVAQCSLFE